MMTIRLTYTYSENALIITIMENLIGKHLCINHSDSDEEIACGELLEVDDEGFTLWHVDATTIFTWDNYSISVF
jgi:hypothetical protein